MKRIMNATAACLFAASLVLAVACGSGDDAADAGVADARVPAAPVPAARVPAAPVPDADVAAAPGGPSAVVSSCLELAGRSEWAKALDPCQRAAKERPDDLKIRHALQQAQAGAVDALGNL